MKIFLTSTAALVLDKMLPELPAPAENHKVLFINTAADPYKNRPWLEADRDKLVDLGFNVEDFDLKNKTEIEIREAIQSADIIFVAGGNTFYLLEKIHESGFDKATNEFLYSDKIYIGSSAGSCVAGPDIEALEVFYEPGERRIKSTVGLHLVDFVVLPHADNPKYAPFHALIKKQFGDKYRLIQIGDEDYLNAEGLKFGS